MTIFEAIILGIVQGATEFLPISSSGHSILIPALFGLTPPDTNAIAIAHQGTLLAVVVYFWRDLLAIIKGVLSGLAKRDPFGNSDARLGWYIVVGSIPAGVIGLLFEDSFDSIFGRPVFAALFLLVTAGLLVLGERMISGDKAVEKMGWLDAIFIGICQVFALFPGVSRSGTTIMASLIRGLDRSAAARYSFLLGVPVILGAGLFALLDLVGAPNLSEQIPALVVTFIVSFIVGIVCIHLLLQWLRNRNLFPFAIYCVAFSFLFLFIEFVIR